MTPTVRLIPGDVREAALAGIIFNAHAYWYGLLKDNPKETP
jgi:hypothetical protein